MLNNRHDTSLMGNFQPLAMQHRQRGMTLVELMVVLVMAMILMTVGIPAMQNMVQNSRLTSETNKMISGLLIARSEAVKRQMDTAICDSGDGNACGGGTDFRIIFIDDNDNGAADATDGNGTLDAGETVLRSDSAKTTGQNWVSESGTLSMSFTPDGMINGGDNKLKLTDSRNEVKCIQVETSGRPGMVDEADCAGF